MKEQGIWGCKVIGAKAGEADGLLGVQITVEIVDGPSKGQRCTYEENVDARTAKYVGWSCTAVGWRGGSLLTLEKDCAAWIAATGGTSTVEIKHIVTRKGQPDQGIWDKVGGIGRGAPKPLKPPSAATLKDADEAMRVAMGAPHEDAPPAGDIDDIPFISCSHREPSRLARSVR